MVALKVGNQKRIQFARKEIDQIQDHYHIVEKFNSIKSTNSFLKRVTHHDTKISNVLFDSSSKGICVIDLDTVMAGFFISDVGDMFRTYLSSANEEEQDLEKVVARKDFYNAILEGYLEIMNDQMTVEERQNFSYAGEFMIYMQALRFITDFINDDVYYGISYEINNYNRTKNQLRLLKEFYSMLN
jgi:thiamine kinase-like enzyme